MASAKDAVEACAIADRLRVQVLEHDFEGEEVMPGHRLTVSIGVAEMKAEGDTVADWIARADNALYKAKSFRKNRVEYYTSIYDRFDNLDRINDDERIVSIKLNGIEMRDNETVTVCINSYRSCGTGGYEFLVGQKVVADIQVDVADAIIEYITKNPQIKVDTHRYCTILP